MEIIVPAAGLSTRFPGTEPKYLLRDNSNRMMIYRAVEPYLDEYPITVAILKQHNELYNAEFRIKEELGSVNVVILDTPTAGPADTVYQAILKSGLDTEPVFVKDCDSFFEHTEGNGNYVCVTKIELGQVKHLAAKSFLISNKHGIVNRIVEKSVVSDTYCIGGYRFESADVYLRHYRELNKNINEVFVSHVIQQAVNSGEVFLEILADNYIDVGTAEEWADYLKL